MKQIEYPDIVDQLDEYRPKGIVFEYSFRFDLTRHDAIRAAEALEIVEQIESILGTADYNIVVVPANEHNDMQRTHYIIILTSNKPEVLNLIRLVMPQPDRSY